MSEMRYRRQLRSFAEIFEEEPDFRHFLLGMLESQLPVEVQLADLLQQADLILQGYAIGAITYLRIHSLADSVLRVVQACPDPTFKAQWISQLGTLAHPQMTEFLLRLAFQKDEPDSRMAALVALQDGTRPEVVEPLLALAHDTKEPPDVRGCALEALGYQADASIVPRILPFLQAPEAIIRWDALYAVGSLGDIRFASFVKPLLTDNAPVENLPHVSIAEDAHEILQRWQENAHGEA